jgi:hypothetical protein
MVLKLILSSWNVYFRRIKNESTINKPANMDEGKWD